MALTSTLFTGLSGLNVNQTRLNVVGNNIANTNTVGFKGSRALFKPQFYVTDNPGSPSNANFGGENPSQRGLGAQLATIEKDWAPGSIEPTGRVTDMAIDGAGFFIVQGKEQLYTRDGSFVLNDKNQLVTNSGEFVQGFGVDLNGNIIAGALQNMEVPLGALTRAQATTSSLFTGNLNANGPIASSSSILDSTFGITDITAGAGSPAVPTDGTLLSNLRDIATPTGPALFAVGDVLTVQGTRGGRDLPALTYTVTTTSTLADLRAYFDQAFAIDTTVPSPVTTGTQLRTTGAPANSAFLSIVGNTGEANELGMASSGFTSTNPNMSVAFGEAADSNPVGESVFTSFVVYDSLGTPLTINLTAVLEEKTNTGTAWRFYATSANDSDAAAFNTLPAQAGIRVGTGTLSFDNDGKLLSVANGSVSIDRQDLGAETPLTIQLDFKRMTALTDRVGRSNMFAQPNGMRTGTLTAFSVGQDGTITGTFDNGLNTTLGQVAIASFDNYSGLVDRGGNRYLSGPNSGRPKISGAGELSAGSIRAGSLELSNVDMSEQFINLIISSTGFSASSRVISTSNQLLTELLQTSR